MINPTLISGLGQGLQFAGGLASMSGVGAPIGLGMNLAGSAISSIAQMAAQKQQAEQQKKLFDEQRKKVKNIYDKQVLVTNPTSGVESNFFGCGGSVKKKYEDGGVILPDGNSQQLASNAELIQGNPAGHNSEGGDVPMFDNNGIQGYAENGEMLMDGNKVLSDRMGYAAIGENIAKAKGKLEEIMSNINFDSLDQYQKGSVERTLEPLQFAIGSLDDAMQQTFQHQEQMKMQQPMVQEQNSGNAVMNGAPQYKYGGFMDGVDGEDDNPFTIPYNTLISQGKSTPDLTGFNTNINVTGAPTGIQAGYKTSGGSGIADTPATNYNPDAAKQGIADWYKQNQNMDLSGDMLDTYYNYHNKYGSPSSAGAMQLAYTGNTTNPIGDDSNLWQPIKPILDFNLEGSAGNPGDSVANTTNTINTLNNPTPSGSFNPGQLNKYGKLGAENLVPFADNVANYFINQNMAEVPVPLLEKPVAMDMTYNIEPQLQAIRNNVNAYNTDINNTMSNSNTAAANKLAAMSTGLGQQNTLWGEKENAETDLRNAHAANVQDVNMRNVGTLNDYELNKMSRDIAQDENLSANISNAVEDFDKLVQDKRAEGLDQQEAMLIALQYMDTGVAEQLYSLGYFNDMPPEFQTMLENRFKQLGRTQ